MVRILVVYASLTGNTEEMAELIAEGIRQAGNEAVLKEAHECSADEMIAYDGALLGAYTWGDGELPDEFLDFYEEMDEVELKDRKTAVFGSGDTGYAIYCGAVDLLEKKLSERGAELVQPSLKIEYGPTSAEKEDCRRFGQSFAEACLALA
ncbi:flavodoxin [Paenibacillus sp. HN-1]|uniref:flavodoxin n=1 Tax=Paenibacillus TaxID=44249 RepID=UPI001CA909B9|nr:MULTISPECIES: flavodoxin [Paenibacillus]MBY9081726.1 flavodoxin [Paenibacillus sp. CGMCC 1.18879]MBY9083595.1 flavodoxin [Paenibacillus sinensis]